MSVPFLGLGETAHCFGYQAAALAPSQFPYNSNHCNAVRTPMGPAGDQVTSFLLSLTVRPRIPDTCAVKSQRQSTSNCGRRRHSTNRERANSGALICAPPDCISHGSGNVASTKRQTFSWPVSQGLFALCDASMTALAAAKLRLTQPANVVKRAVWRLSCTVTGYVLGTIPTKRPSGRTRDFLVEPKWRQWTRAVCGFGASSQLKKRQGCCRRRLLRRQQWSLEQGELLHLATSFETTSCIGIQTAAAANMVKMRGLSELVGVQLVSRARYLSLSEQRPGELEMDRSLESYSALIVRKFGPFFNCWSVLWAMWLLARTAIVWFQEW